MTVKERLVKLTNKIPDDANREEVLRRIKLFYSVEFGLRDVEEGNVIEHDVLFEQLLKTKESE